MSLPHNKIRLHIEQKALPRELTYSAGKLVYELLYNHGTFMMDLYNRAEMDYKGYTCPYCKKDFHVDFKEFHGRDCRVLIFRVQMPKPEDVLQSKAVYIIVGNTSAKPDAYYTM